MIHVYTCECGETFRDKNQAYAFELSQQHRDEHGHRVNVAYATFEPIMKPEPKWRPGDVA